MTGQTIDLDTIQAIDYYRDNPLVQKEMCIRDSSYAVCKYFGIETGENSFGYIDSWSQGKELKELRASLETINKTSGTLISDIERHYKDCLLYTSRSVVPVSWTVGRKRL